MSETYLCATCRHLRYPDPVLPDATWGTCTLEMTLVDPDEDTCERWEAKA